MAILLALETSSSICSVALFQNNLLLALAELQMEKSHSSHITVLINQMLENCGLLLKDLDAVALSGGPGSYTGLRIGTAVAKGLCFSLDIPLIEVSTLHALASAQIHNTPTAEKYLFCPMLDARRLEVYTCILNHLGEDQLPVSSVILNPSTFNHLLDKHPMLIFGSGSQKFENLVGNHSNAIFVNALDLSAKNIGSLAYCNFTNKEFKDTAYYEPFYLKEVYITTSNKNS